MPLHIAAAAPVIPWSDLDYSLLPNGARARLPGGRADDRHQPVRASRSSRSSPACTPRAVRMATTRRRARTPRPTSRAGTRDLNAGEPYDGNTQDEALADQIAQLPLAVLPARRRLRHRRGGAGAAVDRQRLHRRPVPGGRGRPLLQPRALAVSRRTRSRCSTATSATARPTTSRPTWRCCRARSRASSTTTSRARGAQPAPASTATIETCPATRAVRAGRTPRRAGRASASRRGRLQLGARPDDHLGRPATRRSPRQIDPIAGGGACATVRATDQGAGVATYRLPAATGSAATRCSGRRP